MPADSTERSGFASLLHVKIPMVAYVSTVITDLMREPKPCRY